MKNAQSSIKLLLVGGIAILLVLFYWGWLIHITQPATGINTYKTNETIINIEVYLAPHRGSDKLYIITQNYCLMLDTGWRNENKSYKLAEHILSNGETYTITIWKHFPKSFFDIRNNGVLIYQITDLRNDQEIYWNTEMHNHYQRRERIIGIVAGAFMSSVVASYNLLMYYSLRGKKDRGRFA